MAEQFCVGCGALLQTEDKDRPGYVPESALNRDLPVCRRCFRITHYGEFSRNVVPDEEYQRQVSRIKEQPGLVLYVLDVFDLSGSLVPDLQRFVSGSTVVLLVNKVDLLPAEVNYLRLTEWIERTVDKTGIHVSDVLFTSAHSDIGFYPVIDTIDESRSDRVYVVGMANVGKSSVLNRLLQHGGKGHKPVFTVSKVPGTTLGLTEFTLALPSQRDVKVTDTPGLIHSNRIGDMLCPSCLKTVVPSARIRPRVYQLNEGQTLFLGNAVRFDFEKGPSQSVLCYVSNDLVVHRTKLEKADDFMEDHADDILAVPCPSCREAVGPLQKRGVTSARNSRRYAGVRNAGLRNAGYGQESARESMSASVKEPVSAPANESVKHQGAEWIQIPAGGGDITLPGLGWMTFSGEWISGTLWLPQQLVAQVRPRLVGELSRRS
ncbi:ribosome biogenesis GTPase YqeH [Alicyclobacillus sp. SO9]|uniref:ribosome biogenesis GTPase YqeH n=1 Tax=Alicyclobacillus sp. SO9 TaxID=2665646 RepID=UPI0018E84614|nr:ribosome biogenesis GTPase YqeH [Alicyclobacillus sp. SO9]QQE77363.1 ribosome biogenesis GTPase YqeH [Alicyclobacillus sp. SO9]